MEYISTRGHGPVSFETALLDGLAPDGGLYVPTAWPHIFTADVLARLPEMSWQEIALLVMEPFVGDFLTRKELQKLIARAAKTFNSADVTPLSKLEAGMWLLELYHGPTLAFKDVALQMLGLMLDVALARRGQQATVLGATSGDTGSAAIEGLKGRGQLDIFILFPKGRVSPVQQRQMTTTGAVNVFPVAVEGTFDDCQDMVKAAFNDAAFRKKMGLTAVNSISWARLLPQIVYYAYAWSRLPEKLRPAISFSVPTGNFGDVFAGYVAKKCGLPFDKLIIATNRNDILARFLKSGDYSRKFVTPTQSPSMDIQVASNFERLLFDVTGRDAGHLKSLMAAFAEDGALPALSEDEMAAIRMDFDAVAVGEVQTRSAIAACFAEQGRLIDPHTAVGVYAAWRRPENRPVVVLATAHPAKFPDAVKEATAEVPELPPHMADLMHKDEVYGQLPKGLPALKTYMTDKKRKTA
ncbi:MAG: threonine synthase [Proteobacteria bacterium]|nr:threonine synthase [Pseudomonadota bacterium]